MYIYIYIYMYTQICISRRAAHSLEPLGAGAGANHLHRKDLLALRRELELRRSTGRESSRKPPPFRLFKGKLKDTLRFGVPKH